MSKDLDIQKGSEQLMFKGIVRDLKKEDLPKLKPILETWLKDRDTKLLLPGEVAEDLQLMSDSINRLNDRTYFVAENSNGEVIGVIGYKNPDSRMIPFAKTANPAELVNAYVKIDERKGKGVGRALVAKLEESAAAKGYTEIILNSGPRYKDSGWGFYDKLKGYQRVGVAVKYFGKGGDAPVWSKVF